MDADELQAALRALLVPYEGRLEAGHIYGIDVLHRPGSRAHDWFAGVRPGKGTAKLMLLPIKAHPELIDDISPALRKRLSGDALFTFTGIGVAGMFRMRFPFSSMATWDKATSLRTARALIELQPTGLAVGHGPVLETPVAAMKQAVDAAAKRFLTKGAQAS